MSFKFNIRTITSKSSRKRLINSNINIYNNRIAKGNGKINKWKEKNITKEVRFIIINNNLAGGSFKWQKDIQKYIPLIRVASCNELLKLLSDNKYNFVVLINSFIHTDFTIEMLLKIRAAHNFKIILPIHEWYWFVQGSEYNLSYHSFYLDKSVRIPFYTKKLFDICDKIICPTIFVYDILKKQYNNNKICVTNWIDYCSNLRSVKKEIKKRNIINIGVLVGLCECKGKEQIKYLIDKYKNIKFHMVGVNIENYDDNYDSFMKIILKYNIHGLMYLNKWGETWCYGLTKGMLTGLPIFYNNIGAFKERIPGQKKYFINNNNEFEFYDYDMLENNFGKFINYINKNKIFININKNMKTVGSEKLIGEIIRPKVSETHSAEQMYVRKQAKKRNFYMLKDKEGLLVENRMKNIFIITSKIIVSKNKLSYTDVRSIYSKHERYMDTLKTLESIRQYFPNAITILVDNSEINVSKYKKIKKNVSFFLDREYINSMGNIDYFTDISPCKGSGEMSQLHIALNFIKNKKIIVDNIFKITGRYKIFNLEKSYFLNDKIIFKKNDVLVKQGISDKYYYTCFYKFPFCYLGKMIDISNKFIVKNHNSIILSSGSLGLEEVLPKLMMNEIDIKNFKFMNHLGVEQKISVSDVYNTTTKII